MENAETSRKQLTAIIRECMELLPSIESSAPSTGRSEQTEAEYLRVAQALIQCEGNDESGLVEAVQSTTRATTFYKRLAALRFYCFHRMERLTSAQRHADETAWHDLVAPFSRLLRTMQALSMLQRQGLTSPRQKRKSKRQALKGLPPDWRIRLYERGARGKYSLALLISALTGARPNELVKGVKAWMAFDDVLGFRVLCLEVQGAKVKAQQGQPHRYVSYAFNDSDPLVAALISYLTERQMREVVATIKHAGNFTKEVQRLAASLWPAHPETITAYCFRHQWAADVKAAGDADAASRGLGHRSAKTRRIYGTANQSNRIHRLHPVRIEAERPVNGISPLLSLHQNAPSPSL